MQVMGGASPYGPCRPCKSWERSHYHSLPLTTTHYHSLTTSLPLTTTHYHSPSTHYHSLPLTATHYHRS